MTESRFVDCEPGLGRAPTPNPLGFPSRLGFRQAMLRNSTRKIPGDEPARIPIGNFLVRLNLDVLGVVWRLWGLLICLAGAKGQRGEARCTVSVHDAAFVCGDDPMIHFHFDR